MSVLLLNGDYTALDTISVERAMILLLTQKVEILHAKVDRFIRTINDKFPFPEVVKLKFFVYVRRRELVPTKKNIMQRDKNTCQYCGSTKHLTIDHVMPVSRGGENTWKNMVTACFSCNNKKGCRTPEEAGMKLMSKPGRPTQLHVLKDYSRSNNLESWEDYIFAGN